MKVKNRLRIPAWLAVLFCIVSGSQLLAQEQPWTAPLRGSWVQTGTPADGDVLLAEGGRGCEIVVDAGENSIVRQAATFLAGDIERISGYKPPVVNEAGIGRVSIRLLTLGRGEPPEGVDVAGMQGQWEAHRVVTGDEKVWLIGSDPRGTAYAAYTLSERLGIDPLYHWTGYTPEHHDPLVLKATDFSQGPPTFHFRGFFHDDEDILPRPFDEHDYPSQIGDVALDWYKKFFETALRLRMNMVAPYTRAHRRFEVQKLASDWGLYYTSHHYDILVSNPWGLERFNLAKERGVRPEWNWFTNKEGMLKFWRGGVEENRSIDVIWPVGMRGTADRPYIFPPGITDADKARVFREAIQDQVNMVKELLPEGKTPLFHFTMYTEMLDQYLRNPDAFDLPDDVIIVWPDDNNGRMRALPETLGRWKHGVYYHLAYLGGNLSKQNTHIVAPATIAEQFDKIVKAGATEFMLVNVSELREYVMGARMLADITWNASTSLGKPDPAGRFVGWWSREYFGDAAAGAASGVYEQYYSLLDTPDTLWLASDAIQEFLDQLYERVAGRPSGQPDADTLALLQSRGPKLADALAAAEQAKKQMSREQQQYFRENAELGFQIAERQNRAARKLAEALQAHDDGEMWRLAEEARAPLEQLEMEMHWDEHPPFDTWYRESWIRSEYSRNNPHRAYNELRGFLTSQGQNRPVRPARR